MSNRSNEIVHGHPIRCYDNGGKSADRYTVVYMDEPERGHNTFACVGMNHEPFHPQGIGMHTSAMPGKHLGKRVKLAELPTDCQKAVKDDLTFQHYRGLTGWVKDYQIARKAGRADIPKYIRDSINAKIKEHDLDAARVWGDDPDAREWQ